MIKKKIIALFILGISLVGITNADISHSVGIVDISQYDNTIQAGILADLQFESIIGNSSFKVFALDSDDFFFWYDGHLYGHKNDDYTSYPRVMEGFMRAYYTCDNFTGIISSQPGNCNEIPLIQNRTYNTGNYEILIDILGTITQNNYYRAWRDVQNMSFCVSTNFNYSICFGALGIGDRLYNYYGNGDNISLELGETSFTSVGNNYFQNSPALGQSGGGGNNNGGSIGYLDNTNRGVYDAYGENGYYLRNCFSDFSLNNLATSTGGIQQFTETELEDGEYYTGASVIDLYNYYSGGKTFSDWFSYWYIQYRNSISMDSPVNYVGKSKGLWNIAYKFYLAGRSADNLGFTQYYNYCSYFSDLTGSWSDDYNGPDLPPIVNYYITINNSQYDTGVLGVLSGKDLSFDPSSFYDTLTTRLNDLLDSPGSGYLGIIPPYILMVLMALIFIRIIQH